MILKPLAKQSAELSLKERHALFINRELSWLAFNERVLFQAKDKTVPLGERFSFLAITQSNLDEFIRVRIASLKLAKTKKADSYDIAGYTPKEQLKMIGGALKDFIDAQYNCLNRQLLPALEQLGFFEVAIKDLDDAQIAILADYFYKEVYPILTPMAVDSSRPFPLISSGSLNIAYELRDAQTKDKASQRLFATLQVPSSLPRVIVIPKPLSNKVADLKDKSAGKGKEQAATLDLNLNNTEAQQELQQINYVLLEDLIMYFLPSLNQEQKIKHIGSYRIMRDADLDFDEAEADDLLVEIEQSLRMREQAAPIHLAVHKDMPAALVDFLKERLEVKAHDLYTYNGALDLRYLNELSKLLPAYLPKDINSSLFYQTVTPAPASDFTAKELKDIFTAIAKRDRFVSLPYESFDPVLEFVHQAAIDPEVLAIKQTLYRVSGNSPIIADLEQAALNGKQVFVLVELKARFDEQNNILWARRLEKAGCHVIYGLVGLKTHSKITLVVRKEQSGICRYVHLATGNYNDKTAKIYSDVGIFTANPDFGADASDFFNVLSGYVTPPAWRELVMAPLDMRARFYALIDREIANAKAERPAYIQAKCNSICDEGMILKLYEAAQAGVKIDLIVRGINCLRANQVHLSENIRVRSIVGRYLEHARIFKFANAGAAEYYIASADWMRRNLDRRVELLIPVHDLAVQAKLQAILDLQAADSLKAFEMQSDASYCKVDLRKVAALDSQAEQIKLAQAQAKKEQANVAKTTSFTPKKAGLN